MVCFKYVSVNKLHKGDDDDDDDHDKSSSSSNNNNNNNNNNTIYKRAQNYRPTDTQRIHISPRAG
jgi:hypothetical protein